MKKIILSITILLALGTSAHADSIITECKTKASKIATMYEALDNAKKYNVVTKEDIYYQRAAAMDVVLICLRDKHEINTMLARSLANLMERRKKIDIEYLNTLKK